MRKRGVATGLALLAVLLWGLLILFMNQRAASVPENRVIFVLLWGGSVSATLVSIIYPLNTRYGRFRGPRSDMGRAIRQGLLVGILASLLMGLRLMDVLTLGNAMALAVVALLLELMLSLRSVRYY